MRILIVEDQVKMAGLIRRGLRKEGMAADVAVNGEDAVPIDRGEGGAPPLLGLRGHAWFRASP